MLAIDRASEDRTSDDTDNPMLQNFRQKPFWPSLIKTNR